MFGIGEFSKMGRTTIKTLRYYDEMGVLKPEKIDQATKYRFYTSDQLVKLHKIQGFRQIGLSINEIKLILEGQDAKNILKERKENLILLIEENKMQLSRIEFILQKKEEENIMNYTAIMKELPGCLVYSKKMKVPNYEAYFELIPAIGEAVKKKYPDLKCAIPEYCFIIYLDGEFKDEDINVEFCEAVEKAYPDFDGIKFKEIKPTKVISVMHKGPYSGLVKAYSYAFKWIEENGYSPSDHPRESYIDGIWNKEKEEDWLTELQIPIVKK